jgi:hypothetical protein
LGDPHVVAHFGVAGRRDEVSLGERRFGQLLTLNGDRNACATLLPTPADVVLILDRAIESYLDAP